jgi:outer membrane protein TolC
LLGLAPDGVAGDLARAPGPGPIEVPSGLPSQLLERRPDLRAAERRLAAATADIGVATADLYPKFNLTGALQLASRSLTTLVQSDSILGNGAGRLSLPAIGGAGRATVRLREGQAREALLAYQGDVLVALRDVEDALTRLDADRRRVDSWHRPGRPARCLRYDGVRYRHGLASGRCGGARQSWLSARDTLTQAQAPPRRMWWRFTRLWAAVGTRPERMDHG